MNVTTSRKFCIKDSIFSYYECMRLFSACPRVPGDASPRSIFVPRAASPRSIFGPRAEP